MVGSGARRCKGQIVRAPVKRDGGARDAPKTGALCRAHQRCFDGERHDIEHDLRIRDGLLVKARVSASGPASERGRVDEQRGASPSRWQPRQSRTDRPARPVVSCAQSRCRAGATVTQSGATAWPCPGTLEQKRCGRVDLRLGEQRDDRAIVGVVPGQMAAIIDDV